MSDQIRQEVTLILRKLGASDSVRAEATDRLFEVVYQELHRLASDLMRQERAGHTLQSTALINEAYLRLADDKQIVWENRAHFFGVAARAMRQILVDHARRRSAAKRGGGWQRITLHDDMRLAAASDVQVLDLERALTRLSELDERMGQVVELRVFAGLTAAETAHVLDVSRDTVQNDWRVAKMFLARELSAQDRSRES